MLASFFNKVDDYKNLQQALFKVTTFQHYSQEPYETEIDEHMAPKSKNKKSMLPPQSDDTRFDFDNLDDEISNEISQNDFWEYCKIIIPPKKSWGRFLSIDQILSFSNHLAGSI